MKRTLMFLIMILICPPAPFAAAGAAANSPSILIGNFSAGDLSGWKDKEFAGQTHYQLVEQEGRTVLAARADNAASGLFREIEVDLTKTPYLNWEWKLEQAHPPLDERTKGGDDYGARVYVIVSGGVLFWKTRALNYVWSSSQEKETVWPNAFAGDHAMLLAVRTAADGAGTWYREKRNVYEDLKRVFGDEITSIDAVAIMTDSDNAHGAVKAVYGDISFTAE